MKEFIQGRNLTLVKIAKKSSDTKIVVRITKGLFIQAKHIWPVKIVKKNFPLRTNYFAIKKLISKIESCQYCSKKFKQFSF